MPRHNATQKVRWKGPLRVRVPAADPATEGRKMKLTQRRIEALRRTLEGTPNEATERQRRLLAAVDADDKLMSIR